MRPYDGRAKGLTSEQIKVGLLQKVNRTLCRGSGILKSKPRKDTWFENEGDKKKVGGDGKTYGKSLGKNLYPQKKTPSGATTQSFVQEFDDGKHDKPRFSKAWSNSARN